MLSNEKQVPGMLFNNLAISTGWLSVEAAIAAIYGNSIFVNTLEISVIVVFTHFLGSGI